MYILYTPPVRRDMCFYAVYMCVYLVAVAAMRDAGASLSGRPCGEHSKAYI